MADKKIAEIRSFILHYLKLEDDFKKDSTEDLKSAVFFSQRLSFKVSPFSGGTQLYPAHPPSLERE